MKNLKSLNSNLQFLLFNSQFKLQKLYLLNESYEDQIYLYCFSLFHSYVSLNLTVKNWQAQPAQHSCAE